MQKASYSITPEGFPVIGLTALAALVFALIDCWLVAVVFLLLCWFSVHFFRDPERVVPTGTGLGVSPADGRIIKVQPMPDPFTGEPRMCVCIFMNVFNVHVNRFPVDGTVNAIKYHPGKYFNAAWDKAVTDNERCSYDIIDADGKNWSMVQIAGLIARRIVCRVEEGDNLKRGERYGMIRFGSRVDVYLPEGYEPKVVVGEHVFAGQTVIAAKADSQGE
ncbi:phosphatidylserine decarboxylase family protein [Oleidesulfovibrio sp.]|uniref:phosphatidylserine decarboxylase family protein n=1 Tax=Oleidesulfovibrio sp. TaxID=2909707 RepID=UPI003A89AFA6